MYSNLLVILHEMKFIYNISKKNSSCEMKIHLSQPFFLLNIIKRNEFDLSVFVFMSA